MSMNSTANIDMGLHTNADAGSVSQTHAKSSVAATNADHKAI